MEELTLEQLTKNMCKGKTNYITLVQKAAYYSLIHHNGTVNYMKHILQKTREYHKTHSECITHPDRLKYFNPRKKKYLYYTIYTKTPRYRTYRQQCAITYRQLETLLRTDLHIKDDNKIFQEKYLELGLF